MKYWLAFCGLMIVPLAILFDKMEKKQKNAPAKGCLQSNLEFGCACVFLLVAVVVAIMLIVSASI